MARTGKLAVTLDLERLVSDLADAYDVPVSEVREALRKALVGESVLLSVFGPPLA